MLFKSGKMVCTGARSEEEAHRAVQEAVDKLREKGIVKAAKAKVVIQNIVASASLGGDIDLEKATYCLGKVIYEPEQFPGAIYLMEKPRVVFLLFPNGKIVCTGAKVENDVYEAVDRLVGALEEDSLIFYRD